MWTTALDRRALGGALVLLIVTFPRSWTRHITLRFAAVHEDSMKSIQTCWSTRIGFPSGSTTMKLAGPVVLSSASATNVTPCAFSCCCRSRTSVNDSSVCALLVPAGIEGQHVLLEHALEQPDHVVAVLEDEPALLAGSPPNFSKPSFS